MMTTTQYFVDCFTRKLDYIVVPDSCLQPGSELATVGFLGVNQ